VGARFSELNLNDAGIQGVREQDLTVGLNWYPDIGIRFMANWVNVLQQAAPFNRPDLNGIHPTAAGRSQSLNVRAISRTGSPLV
jgi:phosphate-selective porin